MPPETAGDGSFLRMSAVIIAFSCSNNIAADTIHEKFENALLLYQNDALGSTRMTIILGRTNKKHAKVTKAQQPFVLG